MSEINILKAPFPYFGGKSKIAPKVWELLGSDIKRYIEPFAGSLAVLLARPEGFRGIEVVNDWDCNLVNAWRAIANEPDMLAELLVCPTSEVDTEAQHNWLVQTAQERRNLLGDPDAFDLRAAAWWIKGACEWLGSGWASGEGPWVWTRDGGWAKRGRGINRQLPHLGNDGKGINRKLPHLGDDGTGINRKLPHLGDDGKGINRKPPHLGDDGKGEYAHRVEALRGYLAALQDRLCRVTMACGDFERVLTPSASTKLGVCGVFLDPPYDGTEYVYGKSSEPISHRVREWCFAQTDNPQFRIVLAGRGTEHDDLMLFGWEKHQWSARRGYSTANGKTDERHDEALWSSPSCHA